MTTRQVTLAAQDTAVRAGLGQIREELDIPTEFPPEVLAAARAAEVPLSEYEDATDIDFVTIDPEGSMDLDQAVHVERRGRGYRVRYAIADVAAFVHPDGPVDSEARRRGLTLYAPDRRIPLHPAELSEGAASLLPDQERPAAVWTMDLDSDAAVVSTEVRRARVRSRAQLAYDDVQRRLDTGTADDLLVALREVGRGRQEQERARGGVDLPVPEQVVSHDRDGWTLSFRAPLPVEGWNAQISLMTGIAAADIMLAARTGILRTMPPPAPGDLARVRRTAQALGLTWPRNGSYADLIRTADPQQPAHLAFLSLATTLLRGAGYTTFADTEPELTIHSAVAAPYAHVTAPLRRLVDRFGTEIALGAVAGTGTPQWVSAALTELPDVMMGATRLSRSLERESINLIEAVLLEARVGEEFEAAVVDADRRSGFTIVIRDPGVRARARGELTVGTAADVVLVAADPERRSVLFSTPDAIVG